MTKQLTKQEFSQWLRAEIQSLETEPELGQTPYYDAAIAVQEARRIAQGLGYPDLVPPCGELLPPPVAREFLSRCLAVVDPPASSPLTVKQAAERLGLSPKTVYDLVQKGRLRCIRIGRAIRIRPADLEMGTVEHTYKHLRL
jgi:excisionase family DNA binding protein